jgi:uncharacterized protein (TIGR00645 family)
MNFPRVLSRYIYAARWVLYPINVALLLALGVYVCVFLLHDFDFIRHGFSFDQESLTVLMLNFVDSAMVANLIIMIAQGGHQIFIRKFDLPHKEERAQYLDHIDSGLLKVKVAQSIAGITLIQILRDFVNIEHSDWVTIVHRMIMHGMVLMSALFMAMIWRITHPTPNAAIEESHDNNHGTHSRT